MAKLCKHHRLISMIEGTDGEGIFLRNDGLTIDPNLVQEIDDFVRNNLEECEYYLNSDNEDEHFKSINVFLRTRFDEYIGEKTDLSCTVKVMMEEIFDWNIRFLQIDNSCSSLDQLSVKNWGRFQVSRTIQLLFLFVL